MKIYTRTGDDGTTGTLGAERLRKNDPRIISIGEMDELSACLGLAKAIPAVVAAFPILGEIQKHIYEASAALIAGGGKGEDRFRFPSSRVSEIENEIDKHDADLPPLRDFIYPGQTEASARLHLARAVCRRVERSLCSVEAPSAPAEVNQYFNRVSDLLFVLARWIDHQQGAHDIAFKGTTAKETAG